MPTVVTEKNLASRNRKQQSQFRKRQLIEATMDCIDKLGISQTTLAKIAEHAGLSQGIVIFHFQSKEALLEQTLRFLSEEYRSNWQNALDSAGEDPVQKLRVMINASFDPAVCTRKKISIWYAFWGESRSRPKYMELCGRNDQAFSLTLENICQSLELSGLAKLDAKTATLSIEGMIDGLWQNFLLVPGGIKRDHSRNAVFDLVKVIYPTILD